MKQTQRGDPPIKDNQKQIFQNIQIDLIDTEGQSVRDAMDDDHVVELAMSIAKHGLLEPIVVRQTENARYQLEAGFHRLTACYRLNWKTIPAHIRTESTGPTKAIALIENIVRRDMTLQEQVKAVNYLHFEENLSPSSICDLLGKSRLWVDQRLAIPNYPEDVRQELLDGNLTIGKAEILAKIEDDGTRALIINQVISAKLTAKQANDLVEMYLASPSIQGAIEAGIEKKREIQETPKSFRKCELCGQVKELIEIKFITVCVDAQSCNNAAVQELEKMGVPKNAA
jgi:ParB family chromosome partitioning protein